MFKFNRKPRGLRGSKRMRFAGSASRTGAKEKGKKVSGRRSDVQNLNDLYEQGWSRAKLSNTLSVFGAQPFPSSVAHLSPPTVPSRCLLAHQAFDIDWSLDCFQVGLPSPPLTLTAGNDIPHSQAKLPTCRVPSVLVAIIPDRQARTDGHFRGKFQSRSHPST